MITIGATFDKMLKQRIFMLFDGNRGVTHTYNLTISTNKSQYDYGESIVVDGLLLRDNAPLPNVAIYIYKGDTLMETVITDDNGAFNKPISNPTAGEYEIRAFYGSTESNKVNITTRKIVTSLDINVPLSLVYSDAFNITGTLLDVNNSPLSNKPVKLKVGSTVVDTKTTNSNGVVSFTQTPVSMGTHTFQLIYDGDNTYSNISSSSVTRSINKETTVLTVTSPTNNTTIYTDGSISVSGSLVTDDNEKINGMTVYVKEGNTVTTSYTTDGNGVFSGTITGLSASTHTLTFEFEGDSNYTGSSVVRTVIVNNHSYSLSANVDHSAILLNDSVTVSGVLLKDGNGYANQTVTIYDGATSKGTCTTNNDGVYSKTITGLTVGSHSLKAVNTNAESTTVSVTVTEPTPVHDYSLSVVSDKDIISSADGESATLTATLLDNNVAVAGETLNYVIKHGTTTISTGSDTTDNNGEISFTYSATGVGDVTVEVGYGSLLQETYEVTDYIRYDDATTDKTSNYQYNNLNSHTFSTDKYIAQRTIGTSSASTYYSPIYPSDTLPTNYEISVDMLAIAKEQDKQFGLCVSNEYTQTYSGTNQCFLYANTNRMALGYRLNGSLTNYGESSTYNANTWYTFKITVNGTSVSSQILNGDTVVQSWSGTLSNIQYWKKIMIITGGQANSIYWKNLKIKAL